MNQGRVEQLREDILQRCFFPFEGQFASGKHANNKLDMEVMQDIPWLAARIVTLSRVQVKELNELPDLVVPVPNGANWFGRELGMCLGVDSVELDKDSETREISAKPSVHNTIMQHNKILIVDDVVNELTSTLKVVDIVGIKRVLGVFCIWDRGNPEERPSLDIPVRALFQEHIPPKLPEDSKYWQYLRQPA